MASHLRTSIVAIVVLVLAVPVLFWLKSLGLVLGDPWVLALLLPPGRPSPAPPGPRRDAGNGALLERRCQHRGEDQAEQGTVVQAAAAELLLGPGVAAA